MSRRTISATLPDDLIERLNAAAEAQQVSRSRLLEACIETWLEREVQEQMKEGYLAQADQMHDIAKEASAAQSELLEAPDW